ncbi:hypothetical protein ACF0H5_020576 [Mactra antiquata]
MDELKRGLSGYLYVKCSYQECGHVNKVPYGKIHRVKGTGAPCFVVNTKLGTALIDSVGGPNNVNNLLSTLNIPTINPNKLKKMERRAGTYIEKVAAKSTTSAAKLAFDSEMKDIALEETRKAEASMEIIHPDLGVALLPDSSPNFRALVQSCTTTADDIEWNDDDGADNECHKHEGIISHRRKKRSAGYLVARQKVSAARKRLVDRFKCKTRKGMSCAIDTAWQKRGIDTHTFFMSKSKYGKKVLKTVVKHRTCGTCKWWKRNRPESKVRDHRCVHNHVGSARLMESASGEKGIMEMLKDGTPIEIVEGDGDKTLISRMKTHQNIDLKKRFDRNHVVKNIGKHLYNLPNQKIKISKNVISHIQKCLKYVFAKNQGDPTGMAENLRAIIPHQFGDHTFCIERFCGFMKENGAKYVHKSLPYKVPLKDPSGTLRAALDRIFQSVIANATQYADLGSNQQCEHANREFTLRAPKHLHYGNSESLDFRVQASAAFINEGRQYIAQFIVQYQLMVDVNEEAGLSPGVHTQKYAAKRAKERQNHQQVFCLPSAKRRRLILKQERSVSQGAQEALEGISYKSDIGFQPDVDIEKLPDPVPRGDFKPVDIGDLTPTIIAFDLETTDLIRGGKIPHITQIAAQVVGQSISFNLYVQPLIPITAAAQPITGISMVGDKMFINGSPVSTVDIITACDSLIEWLEKFSNVILTAHNGKRFDFPVLVSVLSKVNKFDRFSQCVMAICDSLALFRKVYPGRSTYILNITYSAHDAAGDVWALSKLLQHAVSTLTMKDFCVYLFSPKAVFYNNLNSREKAKNISSLKVLVSSGICKMATAENIAGSGLNLDQLKKIYVRDGEDGLLNTFTMKNSQGQPRVTNTKRILESVIPKLAEYFNNLSKSM